MEGGVEERAGKEEGRPQQEPMLLCPVCNLHTGRRIRGKVYCANCGYIES
jgi:ribosomal protein L37AE/L43A